MYYKFYLSGLKRNVQLIEFNLNWNKKKNTHLIAINMRQSI